jgi:excinuclease UvrABC helicase subunit UvrB
MTLYVETPLSPRGDQPKAIKELVEGIQKGEQIEPEFFSFIM